MTPPGDISQRPPPWKLRRATAELWAAKNPILADGEPGFERDPGSGTGRLKIGDGATHWLDLPYFVPEEEESSTPPPFIPPPPSVPVPVDLTLESHVVSEAPHPFYDDGRNLFLLYQNAKV